MVFYCQGGLGMIKKLAQRKGQSTVEYIILVAAILAALIIFLRPNGVFQNAFTQSLNTGTQGMTEIANSLKNSR